MPNNHMNSLLISKNFLDTYALKESSEYQSFETTDYITPDDAKYNFAITRTSYSQSQVAQLMKDSGSYRYIVKNRAYQKISSFVNMIDSLKTIFIIVGAVVGAFIMGVLNNGMSLAGYSTDIQKIVKGAVLLGAVTLDLVSKRKKG